MKDTTVIRKAAWIIAWDEELKTHTYISDADLAFCGSRIIFIGPDYSGPSFRFEAWSCSTGECARRHWSRPQSCTSSAKTRIAVITSRPFSGVR